MDTIILEIVLRMLHVPQGIAPIDFKLRLKPDGGSNEGDPPPESQAYA
jgi:hypothetical protein